MTSMLDLGEFVIRALLHVALRGPDWLLPLNACASDSVATSVFAVPAAPLQTSTDGTDLGQHAVSSELSPSLHDDNTPHPSSVAAPASSTVVLDKDALGAIPLALPAQKDSVVRQNDSGPQALSAVPHSAWRAAGNNHTQVPVVPAAPPLLPLLFQTALPSFLPSGLISSRTRCRRRAAAAFRYPQEPSAVPHSASRVAGNNRT